jgi:hypothetical protein
LLSVGRPRRKLKTEEHDAQVALFRDHISTRLVVGAMAPRETRGEGITAGVPDIYILHRRQSYFLRRADWDNFHKLRTATRSTASRTRTTAR